MKHLSYRGTVEGLCNELQQLNDECEQAVTKLKKIDNSLVYVFIGFFILFLIGVILSFRGIIANPFFFITLFFVTFIGIFAYRWGIQKSICEKRRVDLAREFVSTVGKDVRSGSDFALEMNLEGYLSHGTLVKTQKGNYFGTTSRSSYFDYWCAAGGKLHDGNSFIISIKQWVKRNEKAKRRATRVIETVAERVRLVVKIDPLTYPRYSMLGYHLQPDTYIGGLHLVSTRLSGARLVVLATTASWRRPRGIYGSEARKDCIEGQDLVALFLHVYSHLAKCR
jgi:hypothetical protein